MISSQATLELIVYFIKKIGVKWETILQIQEGNQNLHSIIWPLEVAITGFKKTKTDWLSK